MELGHLVEGARPRAVHRHARRHAVAVDDAVHQGRAVRAPRVRGVVPGKGGGWTGRGTRRVFAGRGGGEGSWRGTQWGAAPPRAAQPRLTCRCPPGRRGSTTRRGCRAATAWRPPGGGGGRALMQAGGRAQRAGPRDRSGACPGPRRASIGHLWGAEGPGTEGPETWARGGGAQRGPGAGCWGSEGADRSPGALSRPTLRARGERDARDLVGASKRFNTEPIMLTLRPSKTYADGGGGSCCVVAQPSGRPPGAPSQLPAPAERIPSTHLTTKSRPLPPHLPPRLAPCARGPRGPAPASRPAKRWGPSP
jgi:hypothetical protein